MCGPSPRAWDVFLTFMKKIAYSFSYFFKMLPIYEQSMATNAVGRRLQIFVRNVQFADSKYTVPCFFRKRSGGGENQC